MIPGAIPNNSHSHPITSPFNTFLRHFFDSLTVEHDRPGPGWRKGKKKGELHDGNARITKFALTSKFAA